MAKYVNLLCGNCGYSFTSGFSPGYVSKLGATKVKCPKCSCLNSTNCKPYSKFNFFDKAAFWFGRIIRMVLLGVLYGSLLGYGLGSLLDSFTSDYIIFGVVFGVVGNVIFNYFDIRFQIREAEKEEAKFEV
jgi:hypothetical protein